MMSLILSRSSMSAIFDSANAFTRSGMIALLVALSLTGCTTGIKKDALVGIWINDDEKCSIKLNRDFTFKSTNVPLDVNNKYYLSFNKETKRWRGVWSLKNNEIKLIINDDSYYYLNVNNSIFSAEPRLYVILSDESGGNVIYFTKR